MTDLSEDDAEEISRLKDQLEQQEGEISELRRALAEAKDQTHRDEPRDDRFPRREMYVIPTLRLPCGFVDIFTLGMQTTYMPEPCMASQERNQDPLYPH